VLCTLNRSGYPLERHRFCSVYGDVPSLSQSEPYRLVVVAPVYEDTEAASQLLLDLGRAFCAAHMDVRILFVDDGSRAPLAEKLHSESHFQVEVLRLRRNVGHQRAIALGIAHVHEHIGCDAVVVMDADGEDRPEDAVALVARCREQANARIIFAQRTRRSESPLFQACYRFYQLLHWLLTGIRVRVGNFSAVPGSCLPALVTLPSLWNHYAAAIFQARLPRALLPTVRGQRYHGRSKMNFVALVIHGLQAISVFIEIVAVRLLLTVCVFAVGSTLLFGLTLAAKHWAGLATPSWAVVLCGGLFVTGLSLALGSLSLTLGLLAQRNSLDFIPLRDYRLFVEGVYAIAPAGNKVLSVFPQSPHSSQRTEAVEANEPRRAAND